MKNAITVLVLVSLISIVKCRIIGINITISGVDDGPSKNLPLIVSITSGAENSTQTIESTTQNSVVATTLAPSVAAPANSTSPPTATSASSVVASTASSAAGNSTAVVQSAAVVKSTAR
ncbi:uncharacterized protein LOC115452291 [Manduca sexta]|uniref:Uncharacterized protein n=1 Tax=Manduca sexta TaxID=7130 RepID=A0A922CYH7_MANSE|nr:uncharacterized protein LOC115452291 [Manduca sexta]KAG6463309.1 hypothetical protein O3G_MSEX013798 [Manduca sexta]